MSEFAQHTPERGRSLSSSEELVIRPALKSELPELAEIAAEREGQPPDDWLRAFHRFHDEHLAGRGVLLVGAWSGRVAGYGKAEYFAPPAGSPANVAPAGWYLSGLVVRPIYRRRGIGARLTRARLDWIAKLADRAYYFANERNRVSIELHDAFGFVESSRDFHHPRAHFEGGRGVLFVCDLRRLPAPG